MILSEGDRVKILSTGAIETIQAVGYVDYERGSYFIRNNSTSTLGRYYYANELELITEENNMKFKEGDLVVIVDEKHTHFKRGTMATIVGVDDTLHPYDLRDDSGRYDCVTESTIELATEEEEEVTKFKVGDKVKVDQSELDSSPLSGTDVLSIDIVDGDSVRVKDESHQDWWLNIDDVKLVEDSSEIKEDSSEIKEDSTGFNVGDIVTILNATFTHFSKGDTGTITEINSDADFPYTVTNPANKNSFNDREIELHTRASVEEVTKEETSHEFKKGDIVKIHGGTFGSPFSLRQVASIEQITPLGSIRVVTSGGHGWWFGPDDLELSKEPEVVPVAPPMFNAGDRVRIVGDAGYHEICIGAEVTITEVDLHDGTQPYRVQETGESCKPWVYASDIEAVSVTPVAPPVAPAPPTVMDVLENGDAVVLGSERNGIYLENAQGNDGVILYLDDQRNGWELLKNVSRDITRVFRCEREEGMVTRGTSQKVDSPNVIWSIEVKVPPKKMTLVDIEKELGYTVEIINKEGE